MNKEQFIHWLKIYLSKQQELSNELLVIKSVLETVNDKSENIPNLLKNTQPLPNPYKDITCFCGNNGSTPCFSVSCPRRVFIKYETTYVGDGLEGFNINKQNKKSLLHD